MRDEDLTQVLHSLDRSADPDPSFADDLFERLNSAAARAGSRSRTPFLLLAAALILVAVGGGVALGSGVIRLPSLSRNPLPAPTATAKESPRPAFTPTSSPQASREPSPPASAPWSADQIVESTLDGLVVRNSFSLAGQRLGSLAAGQQAFLIAGPRAQDGYDWYYLSGLGLPANPGCVTSERTEPFECPVWRGWVTATDQEGRPSLEASEIDCPPSPMNLEKLAAGRTDLERLACYRGTELTVRGWYAELHDTGETDIGCETRDPQLAWLLCIYARPDPALLTVSPDEGLAGVGFGFTIDPSSAVTMPDRGQWVEVTAHLDDPAAMDCYEAASPNDERDPSEIILSCRSQAVVDSVRVVDGPY
jgi:hypothetical protein